MVIHGYIHTIEAAWVKKMVKELLKYVSVDCILVMGHSYCKTWEQSNKHQLPDFELIIFVSSTAFCLLCCPREFNVLVFSFAPDFK